MTAIEADARVGISVGLAALDTGDQVDALIARADAEMLMVRAAHRSDWSRDDASAWGDEAAIARAG